MQYSAGLPIEDARVTEAHLTRLLALAESAVETADRNTKIARALADGFRSGVRPPEVVLEAYSVSFDRDVARIGELRRSLRDVRALLDSLGESR